LLAIFLVFSLSLRLRQREIQTIFKLGCRKAMVGRMMLAEIVIILLISGVLCSAILGIVDANAEELVRRLFVG
jgi:putative ABC transport system permease protein